MAALLDLRSVINPISSWLLKTLTQSLYKFHDPVGEGFGSAIQDADGLTYWVDIWDMDEDGKRSNYGALELWKVQEEEAKADWLKNAEFILFTNHVFVSKHAL